MGLYKVYVGFRALNCLRGVIQGVLPRCKATRKKVEEGLTISVSGMGLCKKKKSVEQGVGTRILGLGFW